MANGAGGNLALGGGDPRLSITQDEKLGVLGSEGITPYTRKQMRAIRDPSVTFEEYNFYAIQSREIEESTRADEPKVGIKGALFPSKKTQAIPVNSERRNSATVGEKNGLGGHSSDEGASGKIDITDEEWINAGRAIRQASGAAAFYLITTDILGPFGLPYSFATVGWGPGVVLFTVFAVLAGYSGFMMNKMFLAYDSFQYPVRAYGDMAYRLFGQWGRIPVNLLQGLQLILSVSLITISNGQALSVITKFKLCYVVCVVILVVAGAVLGQIRTLQKFGWLANVAVFMNVFIMVLTMAVAAHSEPYYSAAGVLGAGASVNTASITKLPDGSYPPVMHYGNLPPSTDGFVGALNGIMNTVFAYGGANVFNEFMAEMKRPRDFLHAMWCAQGFIWFVYMFYGLFMYGYQGQYSISPSPQSVSPYWALVVANIFYILSAAVAACLYGNIGLKVIYNNIFVELFHAPPLVSKTGKVLWIFLIPLYWIVAFVIGAVIPNFNALVGVVGAICIVQFTYSLPPLFYMAYRIKVNAILPGEGFDPATGQVTHHDSGMTRFRRGLTGGTTIDKLMMAWNVIYFLGALALAGLGAYASISLIIATFAGGDAKITTFSCTSPLQEVFQL